MRIVYPAEAGQAAYSIANYIQNAVIPPQH